jgi:hypothetical protein
MRAVVEQDVAMWWRRRIPPELEPPDPRVPAFADWSRRGIGTIGSGPEAGGTVVADPAVGEGGRFAGYWLLLPVPDLYTESGEHVMDDCVYGPRAVPGCERGLVDESTAAVNVTWWTDEKQLADYWAADDAWWRDA